MAQTILRGMCAVAIGLFRRLSVPRDGSDTVVDHVRRAHPGLAAVDDVALKKLCEDAFLKSAQDRGFSEAEAREVWRVVSTAEPW